MTNKEYFDTLIICGELDKGDFNDKTQKLYYEDIEIQSLSEFLRKDRSMSITAVLEICAYLIRRVKSKEQYERCVSILKDELQTSQVKRIRSFDYWFDLESNLLNMIYNKKFKEYNIENCIKLIKIVDVGKYTYFMLGDKKYKLAREWAEKGNCTYFGIIDGKDNWLCDYGVMTLIKRNEMMHYRTGRYTTKELLKIGFGKGFDVMLVSNYAKMIEQANKMLESGEIH